jgi:riboflavin biosynthesis pyrimidine reductase
VRQLLPTDDGAEIGEPFAVYRTARVALEARPWVLANMVVGIDGSAAVGGRVGGLSSARDRELFVLLRSLADAVLIGAATVRAEGYGPVRLPAALQEQRKARGYPAVPPLAVVTRSLDLDWGSAMFSPDAAVRPIIITAAASADAAPPEAKELAEVIVAGEDSVDLALAAAELKARGVTTLLTEGGPTLLGELMARGLLDELCLTLAPLSGGDPLPVAIRPDGPGDLSAFRLASVLEEDGHLFLRYEHRQEP